MSDRPAHDRPADDRPADGRLTAEQLDLVARWDGLARRAVRRWHKVMRGHGLEPGDVYGAAVLALCEAARRYDPARGPFPPWANLMIHGAVARLPARSALVRPRAKGAGRNRPARVETAAEQPLGRLACHLDTDRICDALDVRDALGRMPERWAHVLRQVYVHGRTARDVGAELGVSRARAGQLVERARECLADLLAGRPVTFRPCDLERMGGRMPVGTGKAQEA